MCRHVRVSVCKPVDQHAEQRCHIAAAIQAGCDNPI
jgi:hypothetical protein